MSFSLTMFAKLFNSEYSISLPKCFYPAFASILKSLQKQKSEFFSIWATAKCFLKCLRNAQQHFIA